MNTVYVIFQFDTEDFITPEADDVVLELVRILNQYDVKVSFCIVGEKARVLERRGRIDVIRALKRHDIAYQSNLHSIHPVISEYVAQDDWDSGVEKVAKQEALGLNDLVRIFGTKPSAFIQPGGSWAPEVPHALTNLGIPVYADGIFESEPFWFCGNLCLKAFMYFPEHSTIDDLNSLEERFRELHAASQEKGGPIVIFSHPCMFVTETFWDSVNFQNGANPPPEKYVTPSLRSKEAYEVSLKVFAEFLKYVVEFPDVRIVTFRDIPNLYSEPKERCLRLDQVFSLAKQVAVRNDWQIIGDISVSPAETLRLLVELIVKYLSNCVEPDFIPLRFTLGPTSKPFGLGVKGTVELKNLLSLYRRAEEFIEEYGRIPSVPSDGIVDYGPSHLLEVAAKAVVFYSEFRSLPESIEIGDISDLPDVVRKWNLIERVRSQWKWIVLPRDFDSQKIEDLTMWQSWTIRPAVFSGTDGKR